MNLDMFQAHEIRKWKGGNRWWSRKKFMGKKIRDNQITLNFRRLEQENWLEILSMELKFRKIWNWDLQVEC